MADTTIESNAPAQLAPRPLRAPVPPDRQGWWWGTGRRKTAVARVRIRPVKDNAKPRFVIQKTARDFREVENYFVELRDQTDCLAPLKLTNTADKFEVIVRASGGGPTGQAGAIRMGLARALSDYDPTLEGMLRDAGYLTRDARKVERKKYGQAGARRRFQFSKR
ncbi:MAG: 30S ribosomal protein S9 [Phycisphaeraceae bacterium]|nr:30S ribosomal protein S9 [Phycisphaeraceae bacterium]MCW5755408.1 30S ribosomal protein S9 [Phycisphaeraceae bacterium]